MADSVVLQKDFIDLISNRILILFNYCHYLNEHECPEKIMHRPFLGVVFSQSCCVEDLLDDYGASNNKVWSHLRSIVATLKRFSEIGYELIHIEHGIPDYRLLEVDGNFVDDTAIFLNFTRQIIINAAANLVRCCLRIGIKCEFLSLNDGDMIENLPLEKLSNDKEKRGIEDVGEIVTKLSTAFLNIASDPGIKTILQTNKPRDRKSYRHSSISEEKFRMFQLKFHNLQSLYDTFVSSTDAGNLDTDLPVLRGHISVVFHILSVATSLSHYYKRHLINTADPDYELKKQMVSPAELLMFIVEYCIKYIKRYIDIATKLCQDMLKKYTQISEITVSVPPYRGANMQASKFVAEIAKHYGSDLYVFINEQKYDATSVFELFRANEKTKTDKIRRLCTEIFQYDEVKLYQPHDCVEEIIRKILFKLADKNKIFIYGLPEIVVLNCGSIVELCRKIKLNITDLQTDGKIDIVTDLKARFRGDKRVLDDLQLLVNHGYGEHELPSKLDYLKST